MLEAITCGEVICMNIDDIPDSSTHKNTERIGLAITSDMKQKLEYLKNTKGKDVPEFLRSLIADGLKDVSVDEAG